MNRRSKVASDTWILILMILAGIVIGGFLGELLGNIPFLSWLNYGKEFGLTSPLSLDLGILAIQFGLTIRFTICGILGIIIAIIAFRLL